jgi:photosystem II stability/assembly factor-like uncharacterized protein
MPQSFRRRSKETCIYMVLAVSIAVTAFSSVFGQQLDSSHFAGLKWRLIGPFRAGRVTAVAGVAGDPNTYYFGTPGGGVWKTNDAGQVWQPIFDKERVDSIGAIAGAPSDPKILYVGTGEQTRGRGMYRSADGGATWQSAGLQDVLFIQAIVVDAQNPDTVIVAGNSIGFGILWQPLPSWANTANRGIFKTTDGGKSWKKVYINDASLGIVDMCADGTDTTTLFAVVYYGKSKDGAEPTSEIIKSSDAGTTWTLVKTKGLPEKARKRMGVAVAPGTGAKRLYAIVDQGFFRSDDGGATWTHSTMDPRIVGSEYFSRIFVDPNHPDVLYVAQTSLYRSVDAGKTFAAYVGAPSGDDFHVLWIDPKKSDRMLLGVDQGAIVSVNGGTTWSSWYNQPTGQFYHVSTDNAFPYRVYGAQQDSGTAGVLSRSDNGEILQQDWYSVGGFEYAYITPDPTNPNLIYSGGWYGSVVRLDKATNQVATLFERGRRYRASQMPPLVFSPQDPHTLYLGTQYVMKTTDAGSSWQEISPDITGFVEKEEPEGKVGTDRRPPPAITAIAPSPVQAGEIWAGTSNRLVYLLQGTGMTWQNVSPQGLPETTQVLYVEASHYDAGTAYLTVGGTRESTAPLVMRTHDFGKTWEKIVTGIPGEMVRVVREDPKKKGLLYAGTDTSVYVSWDEGDHWQPLTLNLPSTPVTDLEIHGNDLVISTFGRGLWILDDVSPLREMTPQLMASDVYLLPPAKATRVRWDTYQDTPFPIETPAGQNPPDGAMIDYFLKSASNTPVTLTVRDEKGMEIASFTSDTKTVEYPPANVPSYWFEPTVALTKSPGVNRFVWDLHYPAPATLPYSYYGELLEYTEYTLADHAVPGMTPRQQPRGPLVVPGKYTVELTAGGKTLKQPLTVELDPRVRASQDDLVQQRDLSLQVLRGMKTSYDAFEKVTAMRKSADKKKADMEKKLDAMEKGTKTAPGFGPINRELGRLISSVDSADIRPTQAVRSAVQQLCEQLDKDLAEFKSVTNQDVAKSGCGE